MPFLRRGQVRRLYILLLSRVMMLLYTYSKNVKVSETNLPRLIRSLVPMKRQPLATAECLAQ